MQTQTHSHPKAHKHTQTQTHSHPKAHKHTQTQTHAHAAHSSVKEVRFAKVSLAIKLSRFVLRNLQKLTICECQGIDVIGLSPIN
jgi:BRCT domain type II-containing protein